jgi:DNA relaxase NicK
MSLFTLKKSLMLMRCNDKKASIRCPPLLAVMEVLNAHDAHCRVDRGSGIVGYSSSPLSNLDPQQLRYVSKASSGSQNTALVRIIGIGCVFYVSTKLAANL